MADNSKKTVAKSKNRDIIKEGSKKPITKITDNAIDSVPNIKIQGFTDEQCEFIQRQHKELLKYSRDNNGSKEVAFTFNGDLLLKDRKIHIGSDDKIDFGQELYGHDIIIMHNHPRNSSYSFSDVVEFISNDSIKTMTIVKNNGSVEILTKTSEYDKLTLMRELKTKERRILNNENVTKNSNDEYRKLVDKFLLKYERGGILKWIK